MFNENQWIIFHFSYFYIYSSTFPWFCVTLHKQTKHYTLQSFGFAFLLLQNNSYNVRIQNYRGRSARGTVLRYRYSHIDIEKNTSNTDSWRKQINHKTYVQMGTLGLRYFLAQNIYLNVQPHWAAMETARLMVPGCKHRTDCSFLFRPTNQKYSTQPTGNHKWGPTSLIPIQFYIRISM